VKQATDPQQTVLKRYAYAYDPAGNRTAEQVDDQVLGASYDSLNRLLSQQPAGPITFAGAVNEPATVTVQGVPAAVGADNTFRAAVPLPPGTSTVTVDATDASGNVASKAYEVDSLGTGRTFTYDANGNLTADGTRTFEWDAHNQLVAWTENSHRIEYSYDGFGRRTYAKELSGTATVAEKRFVWCGSSPCEDRQGPSWGSGRHFFSHGFSELGSQDFYVVDHLGSVRDVTDPSGALVQRLAYDPWGRESLVFGSSITPFTYAEQMDFGGGVALTVHRAYSPELGRWPIAGSYGLGRRAQHVCLRRRQSGAVDGSVGPLEDRRSSESQHEHDRLRWKRKCHDSDEQYRKSAADSLPGEVHRHARAQSQRGRRCRMARNLQEQEGRNAGHFLQS
jgi:hypothetical protein